MSLIPEDLQTLIDKFKDLTMPNQDLVRDILQTLGIYNNVELEFCLNKYEKPERDAAMRMIEKHLSDLLSDDSEVAEAAKQDLLDLYHQIKCAEEEAWL